MLTLAFESGLALLQRNFGEAIFADDAPIPATIRAATGPATASRFGIYRNNVMAGLIKAVAERYPVVRKLLWDDAFDCAARLYVTMEPPRGPVLFEYGESFPAFLRRIGQCAAADYLADIAELEAARTRAYHAADATPVGPDAFAALPADGLADLRVILHPSVALLHSRFPVVSIWEASVYASDNDKMISTWKPEPALVARPDLDVEVRRLSAGAYDFLAALAAGETVGSAAVRATAQVPDFDLAEAFATLIAARVVVGLVPANPHN